MQNILRRAAYLVVLLFLVVSIGAQSSTSRITGTITDSTGSAVEGAKVTLINEATRVSLTQVTSSGEPNFIRRNNTNRCGLI
jgi:Rieske Fe-S protein